MAYTINANAKNVWIRDNENTRDLSIQTDASSVYLENGRTLEQELGEGSMVSNVTTVDSSMSKVIDGTLDGAYESGVMYGKSLVNLVSNHKIEIANGGTNSFPMTIPMDVGKKYLISFKIDTAHTSTGESNQSAIKLQYYSSTNSKGYNFIYNSELADGREFKFIVEPFSGEVNQNTNFFAIWLTRYESGTLRGKLSVFEYVDGMESWDIPYFDGLCDVKMPILRNVGKNLSDGKLETGRYTQAEGEKFTDASAVRTINKIKVKPSTKYCLRTMDGTTIYNISEYHDGAYIGYKASGSSLVFTTSPTTNELHISFKTNNINLQYQLEEGSIATTYEDHKTNILHTPETVTLRSLPSGVRDELNLKTGEYTKRIKEIVLDGSETWMNFRDETDTTWRTSFSLPDAEPSSVCICDKFVYSKGATEERVKIYVTSTPKLSITVLKSEFPDLASFKEWLLVNKPVVQYQLATPITTKVVLTQSEPIVKIGTELPNGVCDTYNLLTGEHIQRVGKVVLDGSEDGWYTMSSPNKVTTNGFLIHRPDAKHTLDANSCNILSNRFAFNYHVYDKDEEGVHMFSNPTAIAMKILVSKLTSNNLSGWKQWLKENPTTVWYELKNPIVTKKNGLPNTHGVTLPSGEADKYNESTGVYTQNLGKVVLDGSQDEEWTIVSSLSLTNTIAFQYMLSQGSSSRADNLICNSFTPQEGSSDVEHIRSAWAEEGVYKAIALFINKTKLPTQDVSGLRSYLASNNIELYYSLPVSKTIDIPLINVGQVLPNGVCDTYNPITKEYVKRINKVMFDGSEDEGWVSGSNTTDTYFDGWGAVIPDIKAYSSNLIFHSNLLCDRLSPSTYEQYNEHIAVQSPTGIVSIGLYSSRLTTVNLSGFKTWLKLNPLTVWYELATPEVSTVDLDLSTLYSSSPVAYENGHIILESGHDGQSLLPTLEYSTVTNRVKQIENIGEQVLRQEKQLTMLEQMLIQNIIGLDYNNTVLALNLEINEVM